MSPDREEDRWGRWPGLVQRRRSQRIRFSPRASVPSSGSPFRVFSKAVCSCLARRFLCVPPSGAVYPPVSTPPTDAAPPPGPGSPCCRGTALPRSRSRAGGIFCPSPQSLLAAERCQ
ncbi:hypothetical protein NDU88_003976 [Pleurodeles waltl]|uniref:Uncharacterized protein n=1 Tax=Pleurodeles waltl TaxID=8319 RepID=A0AAV7NJQ8_PLEWA|nr:hypothetical protein NDU88_003976 [Pleurodeles waltl]